MSEIEADELIDTTENKPKLEPQEPESQPEKPQQIKRLIEFKNVSKLTADEKDYLIDLYKNGGEDDHFKVYFYKNGTNKIVKKKQPPQRMTAKLLQKMEESQKPIMTTEQLLMEHVIDLETKYATLHQKHKKLKKYYKSMQEDLYIDDNDDIVQVQQKQEQQPITPTTDKEEVNDEPEQTPINTVEQTYNNSPYINRIRRQPKGYRRMMSNMY